MSNPELEKGISALLNQARRTWEDLDVTREQVYGTASGTFTEDGGLVVLKLENREGGQALMACDAEQFLLFALRLLNKRYQHALTAPLNPTVN